MQAYNIQTGIVCPLDRSNVDTDQIIPKQFLKSIKRTGFGVNLFDDWRYLDEGFPGQDNSKRPINPDFVLNQPRYQGATILLARKNFGCGSSREHAPWGVRVATLPLSLSHVRCGLWDPCIAIGSSAVSRLHTPDSWVLLFSVAGK